MKHETLTFRFLDMSRGGFARLFLLLLLPCLSVIGVKAADSNGGVKVTFNSGVRYSQWAINSRLYDFRGNQKAYGFAKWNSNTESLGEYANKANMKLDYVAGLVGKATLEASDYYVDFEWAKPWFKSAQAYATDYYYSAQDQDKMTLDNMNAAKMAFHIINNSKWGEDAAKTTAKSAIEAIITDLKYYNEYNVIGGTNSEVKKATANDVQKKMLGGWFHKYNYVDQVWCDGMYMGPALLAQLIDYKKAINNVSNDDWSLLTKQFSITWEQLRDSKTGLLYHGMKATPTITDWSKDATPTSYHSGAFWGRANAWYMLALVDVLELMPTSNTNYSTLKGYLEKLAASIASYQNADGTWYQVLDQKDNALDGNYEESSCSALFTAAYLKALRLKLLESSKYETMAKNAYVALVNKFMAYDKDDNNKIQILGSCCSAGLGTNNNKLRDGSRSYYINGNDSKVVTGENTGYYYTEGKVLGGFIMAATEYERAYQNQDSKQILFARDLAPSYDFSTTAGTLDATAYGNGTITYQWYKDGSAIADATSATYAPTENGSYYCIATSATNSRSAGSNTIQTRTTTVTTANTDNGSTDNNGGSENGETTTIFSLSVNSGANASEAKQSELSLAEYATISGGSAAVHSDKNSAQDMIVNGSITYTDKSTQYVKITLDKALAKGDVIKIATSGNRIYAAKDNSGNTTNNIAKSPYTVDDNLAGATVLYLSSEDNGKTISSITITRPVKKYKVSATAGAGGSVSIANASGATVTSGTEIEANTSLTFTAKPSEGYEFVNWTDASNKIVSANATYTTTVTAAISLTANFNANTTVDPTEDVIYNWNTIGSQKENIAVTEGTKNINGTSVPCINFGSNYNASRYTYMSIKDKDNGGFKAGDIITITGLYTGNKTTGIGMEIHTTRDGKAVFSTPYYNKELQTYTYTLTEDCDSLFFGRYGGATPNVTVLKVVRPAASAKQRLSANFDTNNIKVVTGTMSITLPNLTVKAGSTELAASDYDVNYESDAKEIATLNGTQVNFVSGKTGLVTITAKVTPINATKYEGTEAYYQILIQDPTPLNISVTDIDMNATDAEIKEPVVKVYGENDQLLKLGTDYILSYKSNGGPVSFPDGKLTVAGSSYNWTEGTSTITVTATPTANMENAYKAGSVDFVYAVSKGLITPKFLDTFNNIIVKLATKTGSKDNTNTFTVPLIFNGEDVSSYFDYTYTISPSTNTQSVSGNVLTYTPKTAGTYTVTVSAKPKTNDIDPSQDYTDVYNVPANISFTLDVKDDYIRPVVKVNPVSIDMYTGTRVSSPDVTVTNYNGGAVIDETSYTISWTTFTPGICKVDDNGNIEAVSEGDGKIRVTIKGDKMESTTAFLKVLVDDPAMYRVKSNGETYGNQATMWNQDKTLSVTLGGWMFPNDGIPDTKILDQNKKDPEKLSNSYQWGTASSKAKWKLTGFDYYVSGNNSKNARQENGSNAMPETTTIGSADFKTYTTEVKDPMFNVPCSGSFLVFNPKTNGKVTAHIFQNGAFDTSGGKTSYRPQRRVFVMDEAGNFVTSTAHIESTNGKPTGGVYDLTKYSWDLNGGKAPTAAEVANHFDGLESFEMTKDGFKNNVYPSALSTDIMPNKAIANHPGDKSAHGWCVLADSPVTYTFNVKAGKTYYLYNFGSKIGFYGFSFDKDETEPTVDQVNYNADDATANNEVVKTAEGHVAQVKIARKMVANRWTTCVLPFSLNVHQVDAIFGDTYKSGSENGTQILYFDHIEGNKAYFVRHAYNTIVAGKPFLIKPTKDVESINTADVTDYPYVTIENTKPDDWCESNGYVWTSSYNKMNIVKNDYFIGASDGNFKAYAAASGTVKGFRGFLKANLPAGAKPAMLSISTSSITDGNDGETTGIEDLIINADGELIPANCRVYNINGQLVSEDANSFQSLPSGIYIINGKKYIK